MRRYILVHTCKWTYLYPKLPQESQYQNGRNTGQCLPPTRLHSYKYSKRPCVFFPKLQKQEIIPFAPGLEMFFSIPLVSSQT